MTTIKYILTSHQDQTQAGPIATVSAHRDSDGMMVGVAQNGEVIVGEDPTTPLRRSFMSQAHAVEFLKKSIQAIDPCREIEFEERKHESSRLLVARTPTAPGRGGFRN